MYSEAEGAVRGSWREECLQPSHPTGFSHDPSVQLLGGRHRNPQQMSSFAPEPLLGQPGLASAALPHHDSTKNRVKESISGGGREGDTQSAFTSFPLIPPLTGSVKHYHLPFTAKETRQKEVNGL